MMNDKTQTAIQLKPEELEAVYTISKIVSQEVDVDSALEKITHISRQVLIFDNAVVYLKEKDRMEFEPFFARAIGRGKKMAYDLPWGDEAANETINSGDVYIREAKLEPDKDRLEQGFYLGLPMITSGNILGALIFIRFGGPSYTKEQINLAQFITTHVSQLFEQKRLVETIANLEAERRLARLQDDFIAMVSHDLKTPLGFIKGYTTTLLRKDTDWDKETQLEFLTIIDEEADRLSEMIENLLDSYKLKSGTIHMDLSEINLSVFFQSVLGHISTQEPNLEIEVEIEPSELVVYADHKWMVQVINNLVNNASKYAPNSHLTIRAYYKPEGVKIEFKDTGPGIPSNSLQHIFKRFYRVPERSAGVRGTGLGLFICKQIIDSHQGEIWVESELEKGTTFHILLPYSPPEEEAKNG